MYPYFNNSSAVLLLPALLLAMWAQHNIKSTFERYSRVKARGGLSAAVAARMLLDRAGLSNVPVNKVPGHLTDHYDPMKRTLNLSEPVYGSFSIASLGVAAHECGHAIQHSLGYSPLAIRNAIVPVVKLSSNLAMPLFVAGLALSFAGLITLGIMLFTGAVIFHLVTLPVEFNASSRALAALGDTGTLSQDELAGAGAVLRAAAWTYVAAAVMAAVHLLIMIKNRR
ncbi:MAG: zinc metallopeptidase [Synergistaceae bacterium]|nr:zinc metallopeptidase [Synergistaceae bacterium]